MSIVLIELTILCRTPPPSLSCFRFVMSGLTGGDFAIINVGLQTAFFCLTGCNILIKLAVCGATENPRVFAFELKFYPPDPTSLQEELTRYIVHHFHGC